MSEFSDERSQELRELFFETSEELLQSLNEEALKLEKQPGDGEIVRTMRRIVHTLKGDSAAVGFQELSELAHEFEEALAMEATAAHASLAEIAFAAVDMFGDMLGAHRNQADLPSADPVRKLIRELTKTPPKTAGRKKKSSGMPRVTWTEYEKLAVVNALEDGNQVFDIQIQIDPHCAMPIAARQLILKAVSEIGEVLASRPEAGSTEATPWFALLVTTDRSKEELAAKSHIPTVVSEVKVEPIEMEPVEKDPAPPRPTSESAAGRVDEASPRSSVASEGSTLSTAASQPAAPASRKGAAAVENILRVEAERIDALLNLVGELIIGKSMLQQAINEFSGRHPKDQMRGRFADAMAFQSRVLGDLQRAVMKVRMVSVEHLFRRFPRMVRDVAKQCGKDVQLVASGEKTDLDKGLLDAIAEPMTHLVRNAVSHGIESAAERARQAKPAQGTIRLDAYHQGNQVIIEVRDDGAGIDVQKVKKRAHERGLLRAEDAARLSKAEILGLIFKPGFSTADQITEVSGRGVGLDVVQTVLQRLKGTVQVETELGQGTIFRLQLPLTLAIIKALLFRVEARLYAIPLNAVAEIARAQESDLHEVGGCEILQLRNQVLPILRLGARPQDLADERLSKVFVLFIHMGERKFGLLVNALEGEEELVIKALDDQTIETDLVSGASVLGDGRVVLILNLVALVDRFLKSRQDSDAGPALGGPRGSSEPGREVEIARGAHS
ncbi:MAG TPA: chemotaxis protein CheA [Terriglobales bacterium]|nr:chemotaxis protein CheA [Terriglobales bacterium]